MRIARKRKWENVPWLIKTGASDRRTSSTAVDGPLLTNEPARRVADVAVTERHALVARVHGHRKTRRRMAVEVEGCEMLLADLVLGRMNVSE